MERINKLIRELLSTPPKKESCNCGCHSCENVGNKGPVLNESLRVKITMTENMQHHVKNKLSITENTFRYGSESFLDLWAEARYLYSRNAIHVNDDDKHIILETNLGEYGIYDGKKVPLDMIMEEEDKEITDERGTKDDVEYAKDIKFQPLSNLLGIIMNKYHDTNDKTYLNLYDELQELFPQDLKNKINYTEISIVLKKYLTDQEVNILLTAAKAGLNEVQKNTHKIILTFDDERRIKRVQTTPTFQKMLHPNQIKNLKVGDNELTVNNVALNGLERMESMGLYKLKKDVNEAAEKKNPPIGKPKRGGSKKFYVYIRDKGKIKKVSFGMAGGGLHAKLNNPKARKAFAARHDCKNKKDKTKASYWSCNLPRYAKLLGIKSNFSGYW